MQYFFSVSLTLRYRRVSTRGQTACANIRQGQHPQYSRQQFACLPGEAAKTFVILALLQRRLARSGGLGALASARIQDLYSSDCAVLRLVIYANF